MKFETYLKKSKPQLIKIATRHFNRFIRDRDSSEDYFQCISCGKYKDTSQMNAGHFYPTTKSGTRFDENNVHAQCIRCNHFLSGNLLEYKSRLIDKIGQKEFDRITWNAQNSKGLDKLELIAIIQVYKDKSKN